jgi:thioredoxin reductase (NADPH)
VRLRDAKTGKSMQLECSGVFAFIGSAPDAEFLPAGVQRDRAGYIVTDASMRTAIAPLFAVGAVRSGYAGDLAAAAHRPERRGFS